MKRCAPGKPKQYSSTNGCARCPGCENVSPISMFQPRSHGRELECTECGCVFRIKVFTIVVSPVLKRETQGTLFSK